MVEKTYNNSQRNGGATELLPQFAYSYIKERILNRVFTPGQQLTDTHLAEELGISRTPVRDALRQLTYEGLLVNQARRGWQVYSLSLEDIHEIFDLKVVLEGMIAGHAARCQDEEKRALLKDTMEKMKRAANANDFDTWREADHELHQIIFSMTPNERAWRIVENLNEQWYRLRIGYIALEGRIQRSCLEHEPIVLSILAGKEEEAERCMRVHIENIQKELVHMLVNMVFPFTKGGV
jgi:DNA-binding GntR family transcriptional regulator